MIIKDNQLVRPVLFLAFSVSETVVSSYSAKHSKVTSFKMPSAAVSILNGTCHILLKVLTDTDAQLNHCFTLHSVDSVLAASHHRPC